MATGGNDSLEQSNDTLFTLNSGLDYSCMFTPAFNTVTIVTSIVVFIVTLFGNTLILVSLFKFRKVFQCSVYIFIGNLAVTDIILGFLMLLMLAEYVAPYLGQCWTFCMAKALWTFATLICSMITLTFIAIDRFMAVLFPFYHIVKTKRTRIFLVWVTLCWLFGISCTVIPLLIVHKPTTGVVCRIGAMFPQHIGLGAVFFVVANMLISGVLYGIILWKIKRARVGETNSPRRKITKKTIIMISVFVLFVICWLPFFICSFMLETVSSNTETLRLECVQEYTTRLGFLNSSMNWIVYGASNNKFREAFKRLLKIKGCGSVSSFIYRASSTSIPEQPLGTARTPVASDLTL